MVNELVSTTQDQRNLAGVDLSSSYLDAVYLRRANLRGVDLHGAIVTNADLRYADLEGADLGGADFTQAALQEANLAGADLRGAQLATADLRLARLHGALVDDTTTLPESVRLAWELATNGGAERDLAGALLAWANLPGVDLSAANLAGADLHKADLSGANLAGGRLAWRPISPMQSWTVQTCPVRSSKMLNSKGRRLKAPHCQSKTIRIKQFEEEFVYHRTHWTVEKITKRLELIGPLVHRRHAYLPAFQMQELPDPMTPPPLGNIDRSDWKTIEPNSHWGRRYMDFILHTTFEVPADWESDKAVALYLPLGEAGDFSHPEALAFIDGTAYGTCDRHHQEFLLPASACDGQQHELDLHGWTGLIEAQGYAFDPGLFMRDCSVVQIDQPTRDFIATARVALETATRLDDNEPAKGHILNALDEAFKVLDTRDPMGESFYASVPGAHAALRDGIAKAGPALEVEVVGTGHAHIDVAWLWTLGTTRRKAGRTFTTVQRLMEQFPEYHFTQSQPQLYDYVRQDYPELFEAIKAARGRGALGADRRHVGRGRLQPVRRRIAGAPVPAWAHLLPQALWRGQRHAACCGCLTSSAMPGICRSSSGKPAWSTSSPSRSAGASTIACRTTRSGGRGWTAPRCSRISAPRLTLAHSPPPIMRWQRLPKILAHGRTSSKRNCSSSC